jgi:hypothetical protein
MTRARRAARGWAGATVITLLLTWPGGIAAQEPDHAVSQRATVTLHAFGDINFMREPGDHSAFTLGQLSLFGTADFSDRFRVLVEAVAEAGLDNAFGVEVERLLFEYRPNDHFRVAAGRYHTAIGYYNTAFHHGTWFQTATGRPRLFDFEDDGGLLPVHNVGLTMSGSIPSGDAGLMWTAEIGNGRAAGGAEPVQNSSDVDAHKAVNLALSSRPAGLPGLQIGGSFYVDRFAHTAQSRVDERITSAYVAYARAGLDLLGEAVWIGHAVNSGSRMTTHAGYAQIGRRRGAYTPFVRYQFIDAPTGDPLYSDIGRLTGPSVGLRYELTNSAALKLQINRQTQNGASSTGFATQVAFVF